MTNTNRDILYVRFLKRSLCIGRISAQGDDFKVEWKLVEKGKETQHVLPLRAEDFTFLWGSLTALPIFQTSRNTGPKTKLDLKRHHVIQVFGFEAPVGPQDFFAISETETDPEFMRWLSLIEVPVAGQAQEAIMKKTVSLFGWKL